MKHWEVNESVKNSSNGNLAKIAEMNPSAATRDPYSYETLQSGTQMTSDYAMITPTQLIPRRGLQIAATASTGHFSSLALLEFADDISNGIDSGNPLSPI